MLSLISKFRDLVSPSGGVFARGGGAGWLAYARVWRLALSQSPNGSWDETDGVAFALLARSRVGRRFAAGATTGNDPSSRGFTARIWETFSGDVAAPDGDPFGDCPLAGCNGRAVAESRPEVFQFTVRSPSTLWATLCALSVASRAGATLLVRRGGAGAGDANNKGAHRDSAAIPGTRPR